MMPIKKWKADEMEMLINFKSMRISFVFFMFSSLIYSLYVLLYHGKISVVLLILLRSLAVFFLSIIWYTRNMAKGADSEE